MMMMMMNKRKYVSGRNSRFDSTFPPRPLANISSVQRNPQGTQHIDLSLGELCACVCVCEKIEHQREFKAL